MNTYGPVAMLFPVTTVLDRRGVKEIFFLIVNRSLFAQQYEYYIVRTSYL